MSVSYTYATLTSEVQGYTENNSTAFIAEIPNLIALGETRLVRDLNVEFFDFTDLLLVVDEDNTVAKPDGYITHRSFEIQNASGIWDPLEYRSLDFVRRMGADETALAQPRYIADFDEFQFIVGPYADDDYSIRCRHVKRPEGLSASNTTTWMSTNAGDALLTAVLMEAEQWIKADDRYNDMRTKYYEELLPTIRLELRQSVRSGDYSPFKPAAKAAG